MLDNQYYIKSGHPQGLTDLIQSVGSVTFVAGQATITAAEFGLSKIIHLQMFPWGITTGAGFIPGTTTAFDPNGVDSVDLELVEDDGTALDATLTCSIFAYGT